MQEFVKLNDDYLKKIITEKTAALEPKTPTLQALEYAVFNGGKRLRPVLVYNTGLALDIPIEKLHAPAAAIELIHCYSLVHDDLPAMDNADLRRGKPSCHKAFDEATAILAGDALLTLAFEILSDPVLNPNDDARKIKQVFILSKASGCAGMIYGQDLELFYNENLSKNLNADLNKNFNKDSNKDLNKDFTTETTIQLLKTIHAKKTGALISSAIQLGLSCKSTTSNELYQSLKDFGDILGLFYQVQDDLLDNDGFVSVLGLAKTQTLALNLIKTLHQTLNEMPLNINSRNRFQNIIDYYLHPSLQCAGHPKSPLPDIDVV